MEIEFYENYDNGDEDIQLVYVMLDGNIRTKLTIDYELDMQLGRFVIFGGGCALERFSSTDKADEDNDDIASKYVNGRLDENKKKLFDMAHKEALFRKNVSKS